MYKRQSVNSYDSQTLSVRERGQLWFESSVNSYDSQTYCANDIPVSYTHLL